MRHVFLLFAAACSFALADQVGALIKVKQHVELEVRARKAPVDIW